MQKARRYGSDLSAAFLVIVTRHLTKRDMWEEGFTHSSEGMESIMGERAWQQEHQAAGHIASSLRKQSQVNAAFQLNFLFYSFIFFY